MATWYDRVLVTTTTTGTGTLTLGSAVTGYATLAGVADGTTVKYALEAVDASGTPTGVWEVGTGTTGGSGTTLARTTVESNSSGTQVALSLAAGTKRVMVTPTAAFLDSLLVNSNNLSDLASASTARTNLGLGALATAAVPGSSGQMVWNSGGALAGLAASTVATSGTHLLLTAQSGTDVPFGVQLAGSQTADAVYIKDSAGNKLCWVEPYSFQDYDGNTITSAQIKFRLRQDSGFPMYIRPWAQGVELGGAIQNALKLNGVMRNSSGYTTSSTDPSLSLLASGLVYTDSNPTRMGIYPTDQSHGSGTNSWLVRAHAGSNVGVDAVYITHTMIDCRVGIKPASLADSAAQNGTIYYSTTASKLVFKDSGGTVNNLY